MRGYVAILGLCCAQLAQADQYAVIIGGLGGEAEYEQKFREQADALAAATTRFGEDMHVTLLRGESATREATRRALATVAERAAPIDQVSVTFIGHGTFDGDEYRFNVPGADITAGDLAAWLQPLAARDQLIVLATSSSGAAVPRLQREHRIVVTATKSGGERNATRFAEFWVNALTSSEADRDKNEWITAQEAFDYATRKVADTFKGNAALATEHAKLTGTNAERVPLGRLGNAKAMPTDRELNELFAERLRVETEFDTVKARKGDLPADKYYEELERTLVGLAQTQRRIDARQAALAGAGK